MAYNSRSADDILKRLRQSSRKLRPRLISKRVRSKPTDSRPTLADIRQCCGGNKSSPIYRWHRVFALFHKRSSGHWTICGSMWQLRGLDRSGGWNIIQSVSDEELAILKLKGDEHAYYTTD